MDVAAGMMASAFPVEVSKPPSSLVCESELQGSEAKRRERGSCQKGRFRGHLHWLWRRWHISQGLFDASVQKRMSHPFLHQCLPSS